MPVLLAAAAVAAATPTDAMREAANAWWGGEAERAVAIWAEVARTGQPDALYNLAQAARLGRGTAEDAPRAVDLYRRAMAVGHPKAAEQLAIMLMADPANQTEVQSLLARAAANGSERAQTLLDGMQAGRVQSPASGSRIEVKAKPLGPQKAPVVAPASSGKIAVVRISPFRSVPDALIGWLRVAAREHLSQTPVSVLREAGTVSVVFAAPSGETADTLCRRLASKAQTCEASAVSSPSIASDPERTAP